MTELVRKPWAAGEVFTPVLLTTGRRLRLHLSPKDHAKITRGLGYKGRVTALEDGTSYDVYGKGCESGCVCDAWAVPVGVAERARLRGAVQALMGNGPEDTDGLEGRRGWGIGNVIFTAILASRLSAEERRRVSGLLEELLQMGAAG